MAERSMSGKHLRDIRMRKGLSQTQLAKDAGVSRVTIRRLEKQGLEHCVLLTAKIIAEALGVTIDDLISDTGEK